MPQRARYWLLLCLLVGTTAVTFAPVGGFEATDYDDQNYVFENPQVLQGLSWPATKWAITTGHASNWHPLTWLSHQADVQFFGAAPGAHHLVNLALHCLNVALVFALFCRITGALWRSAFVTALFGWHPLHVESVAWIAERKDVLSTAFGLLTLLAYAKYTQGLQPTVSNPGSSGKASGIQPWKSGAFWLALVCFALGLMSKPMLVTLPVIMLLLDVWPLQRTRWLAPTLQSAPVPDCGLVPGRQLILEKLPFLLLAVVSSGITVMVQHAGGAVRSIESFSLMERVANALTATVLYLGKMLWPVRLTAFYPLPSKLAIGPAVAAGVLLIALTVVALRTARRAPHRLVGWLWFLVMLMPVIGVIQVGMQQMADRYTYLPLVGIFVLVTWEADELIKRFPALRLPTLLLGLGLLVTCRQLTRFQLQFWQDSSRLFRHALEVTHDNFLAHQNLGYYLFTQGDTSGAIAEYDAALRILPDYTDAHSNLGRALASQGRYQEAAGHLQAVLRRNPDDVIAHNNLGNVLAILGKHEEAITHFRAALAGKPDHFGAHNNWGLSAEALNRPGEALAHYQAALQLNPNFAGAMNNLAWLLATCSNATIRNGPEALQLAQRACQATDCSQPTPLLTLAAASAECGQLADAISLTRQALETATAQQDDASVARAHNMLAAFQTKKPFRALPLSHSASQ